MTEEETRREVATMLRSRAYALREDEDEHPCNVTAALELESLALSIEQGAMSEAVRISVLTHEMMLLRAEVKQLRARRPR